MKNLSLSAVGNPITGLAGGRLGAQLLSMPGIATGGGDMDTGSIFGSIASEIIASNAASGLRRHETETAIRSFHPTQLNLSQE